MYVYFDDNDNNNKLIYLKYLLVFFIYSMRSVGFTLGSNGSIQIGLII